MKFNLFTAKSLANRHPEPKSDQLYLDIKIANYVRYKRRGKYVVGRFYKEVTNYPVMDPIAMGLALRYLRIKPTRYHLNGIDCTEEVNASLDNFVTKTFGR